MVTSTSANSGSQKVRDMRYDIAVIGNDEAAFEMLSLAACAGKRSIAVLPEMRHSSWLVSQALRRLVSGLLVDRTPARSHLFHSAATPRLLRALMSRSVVSELAETAERLQSRGTEIVVGEARFVSSQQLTVHSSVRDPIAIEADHVVVGTGVRRGPMNRPAARRPFYGPEQLLSGARLPASVCVVGGGHFGAGLAALVSLFGVETRLVSREDRGTAMLELSAAAGVTIGRHPSEVGLSTASHDVSSVSREVIDCRRSTGFTRHLGLETISVEPDENGQLWCASHFETWCAGVFGVGDVVGFSPETSLHPVTQAQRVMNHIQAPVPRPRMLDGLKSRERHAG